MRFNSTLSGLLIAALFLASVGCSESPAQAPPSPPLAPTATAAPVAVDSLVGPVYLGTSDLHTCTGSVLHSSTGNLILTAAHCLAAGYPTTFAPGFKDQPGPAGVWNIDAVYVDPQWLAKRDPLADIAIARVTRPDGASVENVVGPGFTLGNAPSVGTVVSVIGYPLSVGGSPIGCHGETSTVPAGFPSVKCAGMIAGTSGAPWRTDTAVVGLIGGLNGGGCEENVSYSPPFDGRMVDLLRRAEAGGPGDAAPQAFEDDC
jgi:hypothetical protein